jgi:hypothetical protein
VRAGILLVIALCACASVQTDVTLVDPSAQFAPTSSVELVLSEPTRPYSVIGMVEAHGPVGTADAQLIEALREEAREIGANGIYVLGRSDQQQQQGLMYNPWLGGYQTTGGGTMPGMKAAALRWQ